MDAQRGIAGTLFLASGTNAMDVYSAVNSSPWTAYKHANDEQSIEAMWKYVRHAIVVTAIMNVGGAVIARSWLPIFGATISGAYMYWLYWDAVNNGKAENSQPWESQ